MVGIIITAEQRANYQGFKFLDVVGFQESVAGHRYPDNLLSPLDKDRLLGSCLCVSLGLLPADPLLS